MGGRPRTEPGDDEPDRYGRRWWQPPASLLVALLLAYLAPLYDRAGRAGEFRDLVTSVRAGYKRRPNLMKRLDRAGL